MNKYGYLLLAALLAIVGGALALTDPSDASPAVGDAFSDGGMRYAITSVDPLEASVAYGGNPTDLVVPEEVEFQGMAVKVTGIGPKAFYGCKALVSADLGSVSEVGMKAFAHCTNLRSLDIGDSLESIGIYAFYKCISLTDLSLGASENLSVINSYAFYGCKGLKTVDFGSVERIGLKSFAYCGGIGSADIPASKIADYAFAYCTGLYHVSFSDSLWYIGKNAFYKVTMQDPAGKRVTSAAALKGQSFDGSDGILRSGTSEFVSGGLRYSVVSPSGVSVVGYVGEPASIAIPSSVSRSGAEYQVVSVAARAFYGCSSLESVDLGGVKSIGFKSFANCTGISSLDVRASDIDDYAFANCAGLTHLSFSKSLVSVGKNSFYNIALLGVDGARLTSASDLRGQTFEGSDGTLAAVSDEFVSGGLKYSVVSSMEASVTGYVGFPVDVAIPDSVQNGGRTYRVVSVWAQAFYGCESLESVDLGSVWEIGLKAFANCKNLRSVEIPVSRVYDYAFANCTGLSYVSFADGMDLVSKSAFYGVPLYDVNGGRMAVSAEALGGKAFSRSSGELTEYGLGGSEFISKGLIYSVSPEGKASVTGYLGSPVDVAIPAFARLGGGIYAVESVGAYAFYGCSSLRTVEIASVQSIGMKAFANCANLVSADVSASEIGGYAFANCAGLCRLSFSDSLSSVSSNSLYKISLSDASGNRLPASADDIRGKVFAGSTGILSEQKPTSAEFVSGGLRYSACTDGTASVVGFTGNPVSITIPISVEYGGKQYSVVSIGDKAFYGCQSLKSVDFGDVNEIGFKAFANCANLGFADIPASAIGDYAFANCAGLAHVSFPESLCSVGKNAFYKISLKDPAGMTASSAEDLLGRVFEGAGGVLAAVPEEFASGGLVYGIVSEGSASVKGYAGAPVDIAIPASVAYGGKSYQVVSVSAYAFYGCESLRSVGSESALDIGFKAFANCANLADANVLASSVGDYAFGNCVGLSSISFPGSLGKVWENAFWKLTFAGASGEAIEACAENLAGKAFAGSSGILAEKVDPETYEITILIREEGYGYVSMSHVSAEAGASITMEENALTIGSSTVRAYSSADTPQYKYIFTGWDVPCSVVGGDMAVTAVFYREANQYEVTWLNEDGSVIAREYLDWGAMPSIREPAKESDGQYSYEFRGWEPEVSKVTGDAVYTASFDKFPRTYTVTVVTQPGEGGAVSVPSFEAEYGAAISADGNVLTVGGKQSVAAANVGYVFSEWMIPSESVGGDMIVSAVFDSSAEVGTQFFAGGIKYQLVSQTEASVIGYEGEIEDLGIPEKVRYSNQDYFVKTVGENAFRDCKSLETLDLTSIESIGKRAFSGCDGIAYVVFGKDLCEVGVFAFRGIIFEDQSGIRLNHTAANLAGCTFEYNDLTGNLSRFDSILKFTVRFDSMGGTNVDTQIVQIGMKATPQFTSKTGSKFVGWFVDSPNGEEFSFDSPINRNIVLYARWVDEFTVVMHYGPADGVDDFTREYTRPYLEQLDKPEDIILVRDSKVLIPIAYYSDSSFTEPLVFPMIVTSDKDIFVKMGEKTTFKFNYVKSKDGNTEARVDEIVVGSGYKFDANEIPRPNYQDLIFLGWYTIGGDRWDVPDDMVASVEVKEVFARYDSKKFPRYNPSMSDEYQVLLGQTTDPVTGYTTYYYHTGTAENVLVDWLDYGYASNGIEWQHIKKESNSKTVTNMVENIVSYGNNTLDSSSHSTTTTDPGSEWATGLGGLLNGLSAGVTISNPVAGVGVGIAGVIASMCSDPKTETDLVSQAQGKWDEIANSEGWRNATTRTYDVGTVTSVNSEGAAPNSIIVVGTIGKIEFIQYDVYDANGVKKSSKLTYYIFDTDSSRPDYVSIPYYNDDTSSGKIKYALNSALNVVLHDKMDISLEKTQEDTEKLVKEYVDGSGTKEDPYVIYNSIGFRVLQLRPNAHFVLGSDITMESGQLVDEDDLQSIRTIPIDAEFNGSLSGNGHSITGINIISGKHSPLSDSGFGIFRTVGSSGIIENIVINNAKIDCDNDNGDLFARIGTICGVNHGTISNVTVNSASLSAERSSSSIGGIAGLNYGTISDCSVTGTLLGGRDIGGIAGWNAAKDSKNHGSVEDCDFGYKGGSQTIGFRYYGKSSSIGGIVGYNNGGDICGCNAVGFTIEISLHSVDKAKDVAIGTVVGSAPSGTLSDIHSDYVSFDKDLVKKGIVSDRKNMTMIMDYGHGFAKRAWPFAGNLGSCNIDGVKYNISETGYTYINDGYSFYTRINSDPNGKYYLTNDIALSYDYTKWSFSSFNGILNGGNHIVNWSILSEDPFKNNTDLNKTVGKTIENKYPDNVRRWGLFPRADGALIENLTIKNAFMIVNNKDANYHVRAGIIVGSSYGNTTIDNCHVDHCCLGILVDNKGTIINLGGIVGHAENTTRIANCWIKDSAIVGYSRNGTVYVGGIVGKAIGSTVISGCVTYDNETLGALVFLNDGDVGGIIGAKTPNVSEYSNTVYNFKFHKDKKDYIGYGNTGEKYGRLLNS